MADVVLGTASVEVSLDTDAVAAQAANLAKGIGSSLGSSARAIGQTITAGLKTATVAFGALSAATIKSGADFNILSQGVTGALTAVLGTRDAARELIGSIVDMNQTAALSRQSWLSAGQQLASFGAEAESIPSMLRGIEDAVLAVAGGDEEFARLADILARVETQGSFTGEAIQRMGELGLNPAKIAAEQLGISLEEAEEALKSGEITAAQFTELLSGRFSGAVEGYRSTWAGATGSILAGIRNIGAALTQPFIDPDQGGAAVDLLNAIADAIYAIAGIQDGEVTGPLSALVDLSERAAQHVSTLADRINEFTKSISSSSLDGFIDSLRGLGPLIAAVGAGLTTAFAGSLPVIGQFVAGFNPIVVAVGALIATTPELRTAFVDVFQDIFNAIQPLLPVMRDLLRTVLDAVTPALVGIVESLGGGFAQIATAITPLVPLLGELVATLVDALAPIAEQLIEIIANGLVVALEALTPILPIITEAVSILGELFGQLLTALEPLIETLLVAASIILEALTPVLDVLVTTVGDLLLSIVPLVAELAEGLAPILILVAELIAALMPIITPLIQGVSVGLTPVIQVLSAAISTLIGWISSAIDWLKQWIEPISNAASTLSGNMTRALGTVSGAIESFRNWIGRAISKLGEWLQPLRDAAGVVKDTLGGAVNTVAGWIDGFRSAIRSAVEWLGSKLTSPLGTAASVLRTVFGPAIDGARALVNGIRSAIQSAVAWIGRLSDGLRSIPSLASQASSSLSGIGGGSGIAGFLTGIFGANGGIFDRPTPKIIGEAGAEVLIPLTRPARARELAVQSGLLDVLGIGSAESRGPRSVTNHAGNTITINTSVQDPDIIFEKFTNRLGLGSL